MQYVGHSKPKLLIADEGKKIRNINDLYIPAEYDEEGNLNSCLTGRRNKAGGYHWKYVN